jgi:hypothetical protein
MVWSGTNLSMPSRFPVSNAASFSPQVTSVGNLTIGFGSMPDTDNCDLVLRNREDYTIIANSNPKVPLPLPGKRPDIA